MAVVQAPQVLTANRLTTGDVLYWRGSDWVERFLEAELLPAPEIAAAALEAAQKSVRGRLVVNPYLFPVRVDPDGICPVEVREVIRATGPSVRRDLGKQASSAGARHV